MVTVDTKEFEKDLEKLIKSQLPQGVEKGLLLSGEYVRGEATKNAPFDTGRLGLSINKEVKREGKRLVCYVGTNVKYAIYVHQGTGIYAEGGSLAKKIPWLVVPKGSTKYKTPFLTVGQRPQPFLKEAVNNNTNKIRELILKGLKNA